MARGSRIARKSTKGKGKLWSKGHSCSSNPEAKQHRDAARSRFFQVDLSGRNFNLTTDALQKHNAIQQLDSKDDDKIVDNSDIESIGCKTFDTFATNWTSCTNPSFSGFLTKFQPDSAAHKDRLSVLAAVTEIIKSRNGKETETEYFAALMTTLEVLDSAELIAACSTLLGFVIKRLPVSVLKVKFSEASKCFLDVLYKYADGENQFLVKGLIGCLSVMLRAQELAVWNNSSTLQTFQVLLSFTTHMKPKVRQASQHAVCAVLKASNIMLSDSAPSHHPAATTAAKYCIHSLETNGTSDIKTTLHVLNLLRNIASTFPRQTLKSSCENVLRLLASSDILLTSCCFTTLHGLFIDRPKATHLPAELQAQLITALYDFQPSENDIRPTIAWLTVMREALFNLQRLDEKLCFEHVAHFFSVASRLWLSSKPAVRFEVTSILKSVLQHCAVSENVKAIVVSNSHADENMPIRKILRCLEDCLAFGYHSIWSGVFRVLAVFFELLGGNCRAVIGKCLRTLADLRRSPAFAYSDELDHTVGMAVRSAGPRVVIQAIPFKLEDESLEDSWLIPVLRDNIRDTELSFFAEYFMPLAAKMKQKSKVFEAEGRTALSKSYLLLHNQVWSLLPGFCTRPTDLAKSFPGLAKMLGSILVDDEEQRQEVMASLRRLVSKNLENDENRAVLSKFAKNYIPILLNLFTTEDVISSQRLVVFQTIKLYIQIADSQLHFSLLDKALEKLEASDTTQFVKHAVLDLSCVLLPYVDDERIVKLHDTCVPLLKSKDHTLQKKVYRIFEELCSAKTDSCKLFVQRSLKSLKRILIDALPSTKAPSNAPRLRCLRHLVQQFCAKNRKFLISIIPEVISCAKESTHKVKSVVLELLIDIGNNFVALGGKSEGEILHEYIQIISAGLAGSTHTIGATVISLSHVVRHFTDKLSVVVIADMLKSIFLLMTSEKREIVGAALEFLVTVIVTIGDVNVAHHLEEIVKSLGQMREEMRSRFRMRIRRIFQRLIRKFGFEAVNRITPKFYLKLLVHIRKQDARAKRLKSARDGVEEENDNDDVASLKSKSQTLEELLQDSDGDDDEDEMEKNSKNGKKSRKPKAATWIHEDAEEEIVDFLDPKSSRNISATRPETEANPQQSKKDDYRIAPDGRLIIVDEDEEEVEENPNEVDKSSDKVQHRGEKRKLDDDDDNEDDNGPIGPLKYRAGGHGIHRPIKIACRPSAIAGREYKAKKAGGDIKKKGKPDPYAYLPLNSQTLNRRKKAKMAGQFNGIVGAARKGARQGHKVQARRSKKH